MSSKKNKIVYIIIIVSTIVILALVYKFVFNQKNLVNQGNFRVNDIVVKSEINVMDNYEEVKKENEAKLEDIKLNLSQNNKISLLLANVNNVTLESATISNFEVNNPEKVGKFYFSEQEAEEIVKTELGKLEKSFNVNTKLQEDGQYLIEIWINNEDFLTGANLPEDSENISYDGTLLKNYDISKTQLDFKAKFDLILKDNLGKKSICKFELEFPDELLITQGISITRKGVGNYLFSIID